jgi:antiviral helicase SLH1
MHRLLIFCVGDMQLTKSEIAETQVIVTTPEKWDVVTRKPTGEGELASVRLHINPCSFTRLTVFYM